jgi:UDP-glucose 4-epimerase
MADATKLREATGWEPEVGFKEGVARVCGTYTAEQ